MRHATILFRAMLIALLPLAVSCEGSADENNGEKKSVSAQDVGKKIGEAADATAAYVSQEWKQFSDSMRARLDKVDERIKELKKQAADATGDAKRKLELAVEELQKKQEALRERLKELGDRSGAAWEEAADGFRRAMDEFEKESKEPVPTPATSSAPAAP